MDTIHIFFLSRSLVESSVFKEPNKTKMNNSCVSQFKIPCIEIQE